MPAKKYGPSLSASNRSADGSIRSPSATAAALTATVRHNPAVTMGRTLIRPGGAGADGRGSAASLSAYPGDDPGREEFRAVGAASPYIGTSSSS
jgi:hypothetical protein